MKTEKKMRTDGSGFLLNERIGIKLINAFSKVDYMGKKYERNLRQ